MAKTSIKKCGNVMYGVYYRMCRLKGFCVNRTRRIIYYIPSPTNEQRVFYNYYSNTNKIMGEHINKCSEFMLKYLVKIRGDK
jgi:hypothetical protein